MARCEKVNIAVIGLGMGRAHLDSYAKSERANVVAICDADGPRLEQIAKQYNIPAERCFADCNALVASAGKLGLHAVSVALPNALHAPVSVAAARKGLHVLCEKPMAMNVRQAKAMIAAANKARKKLMINFSFRFTEQSQALKRLVDSGAVGQIYFGRTAWHRRRGMPRFGGWFGQRRHSGGGPIIDLGVHRLDLALWLMGHPRPVTVSGSTFGHIGSELARRGGKDFDVEDLGCALIRFDNGATLVVEASWAGFSEKKEDMVTQLYGTRGGLIQRNVGEGYEFEARAYSEQHGTLWESRLQQTTVTTGSAYQEFVNAIVENRPVSAPAEHGLDVQLILDAIYKSARVGKEVPVAQR